MKTIKILSRHNNIASAVKAANLEWPDYENTLTSRISTIDRGSASRGMKPCTQAFVVEAFGLHAIEWGQKFEILYVTDVDIRLLNKLEKHSCLDDGPLNLVSIVGEEIQFTGTKVPKTKLGRKFIALIQADKPEVYATGL